MDSHYLDSPPNPLEATKSVIKHDNSSPSLANEESAPKEKNRASSVSFLDTHGYRSFDFADPAQHQLSSPYSLDSVDSNFSLPTNGSSQERLRAVAPRNPRYTRHHIDEHIGYDMDRFSPDFGTSYVRTKQHVRQEQNRFIYKIRSDLRSDSLAVLDAPSHYGCENSIYSGKGGRRAGEGSRIYSTTGSNSNRVYATGNTSVFSNGVFANTSVSSNGVNANTSVISAPTQMSSLDSWSYQHDMVHDNHPAMPKLYQETHDDIQRVWEEKEQQKESEGEAEMRQLRQLLGDLDVEKWKKQANFEEQIVLKTPRKEAPDGFAYAFVKKHRPFEERRPQISKCAAGLKQANDSLWAREQRKIDRALLERSKTVPKS